MALQQGQTPQGVYLWGPVGRGKTWLMDQFYTCLQVPARRQHFHHFMRWVHQRLFQLNGTADPLLPVMHGVHVAAHIKGSELKLIPGLAHRFQEAFKEPLLAAVLPHLRAHRGDGQWARL